MANRSCAAIVDNGQILMVRQTYKGETFWTFPGGRIETGESPEGCAVREVLEETGLSIEITGKACEYYSERLSGMYYCLYGRIAGGSLRLGSDPELPADSQELHAVGWHLLADMRQHPEVRRILQGNGVAPI
jgi:8-oxo-dGTP diphosphatase